MGKLGIYGGTFNPIHCAHLTVAENAMEQFGLDRVMFLPNATPPHKMCNSMASAADRLEMVKLAVSGNERFFVSDYEISRGGISYTFETLEHFRKIYPDDKLYFIIGGDSLRDFPKWRNPESIVKNCIILAYPRDGLDFELHMNTIRSETGAEAYKINSPQIDISSSQIRSMCAGGMSVAGLVPECIEEKVKSIYIKD